MTKHIAIMPKDKDHSFSNGTRKKYRRHVSAVQTTPPPDKALLRPSGSSTGKVTPYANIM
jgi:hypothetical protein